MRTSRDSAAGHQRRIGEANIGTPQRAPLDRRIEPIPDAMNRLDHRTVIVAQGNPYFCYALGQHGIGDHPPQPDRIEQITLAADLAGPLHQQP